jgi:hypothetical protein
MAWRFDAGKGGTFQVEIDYAADEASEGARYEVAAGGVSHDVKANLGGGNVVDVAAGGAFDIAPDAAKIKAQVKSTGGREVFLPSLVDKVSLPEGLGVLTIKPVELPEKAGLMELRGVRLIPVER